MNDCYIFFIVFYRFSNYSARTPVTWLDYAGGTGGVASPDDVIDNEGIYRGKPM